MKIVCSSDWHGDHVTHGVRRFAEVEAAVHETVDRAIEEQADVYAFLGDLCNPDSGSSVFRVVRLAVEAASKLAARGIWSIWIAGNHDVVEDGSGETTLTPLSGLALERVVVCEKPRVFPIDSGGRRVWFLALPYTATSHAYDPASFVSALHPEIPKADLVTLAHMTEIAGVEPGEETLEMSRGRGVPLPMDLLRDRSALVMNGHFHRQQKYGGVWIPGSLARLTFCEERHEPGYLVVEV